jgi:hypothetical protein
MIISSCTTFCAMTERFQPHPQTLPSHDPPQAKKLAPGRIDFTAIRKEIPYANPLIVVTAALVSFESRCYYCSQLRGATDHVRHPSGTRQ